MRPTGSNTKRAFTLIELLIVIAIIALLSGILFPVFARARDKARQAACASNLKQIGLGLLMYMQDYDDRSPAMENNGGNSRGWAGRMYPYVKNTQIFVCPSDQRARTGLGTTSVNGTNYANYLVSYAYNQSIRSATSGTIKEGVSLAGFTAPSLTVMLFELDAFSAPLLSVDEITSQGHAGSAGGGYVPVMGVMDNATGYGTFEETDLRHHAGNGGNWLFTDGHVKFINASNISCGSTPFVSTAAQYSGPATCQSADGSFPARCAEGAGYTGAAKHQGTFSYR